MAKFLNQQELYRLLQRELPDGVYQDGQPNSGYSSSSIDSKAKVLASVYALQQSIYNNMFPQTADDQIGDWEIKVFGSLAPASLTLQQRRDRVIAAVRLKRSLSSADMKAIVLSVIGQDKLVDIIEWGNSTGGWLLDESQLDIDTYLNGENLVDTTGPGLCGLTAMDVGKTDDEWALAKEEAYTYGVLIYTYVPTSDELSEIDRLLTKYEPARSTHYITSGLDPADMIDGDE